MTRTNKITITKQQETPLSKEQKQFNKLNSQIAKEKEQLLNWQNRISEFKIVFANELTPLQSQHDKLRAQLVYLLDEIYDNKLFTKNERKKMLYIVLILTQLGLFRTKQQHLLVIPNPSVPLRCRWRSPSFTSQVCFLRSECCY